MFKNTIIVILLLFGVGIVLSAASALAYRPTVDTAVNRIVDESYRADPLEDALTVEREIGGGNTRVWVVAAFILAVVAVGAGILAYLYFGAEHAKRKAALIKAQKQSPSANSSTHIPSTPWVLPMPDQVQNTQRALPAPDSEVTIRQDPHWM